LAVDVEEDFVGFGVGVDVRNFDGQGVVVEVAGGEGADDESVALEDLPVGREKLDGAGEGLEIVGVEGVGIDHAVPAGDVEGVVGLDDVSEARGVWGAVFDEDFGVLLAVDDEGLGGTVDVAFGLGGSELDLAVGVVVAFGEADGAGGFEDEVVVG